MNANENNNRTKAGRPPKLQDINEVEQKINDYFTWCDTHPLYKPDFIRSGEQAGTIVDVPIQRPYTIEGICLKLSIDRVTFWNIVNKKTENAQNDKELFNILTYAHERVRGQQVEGATANIYNSNLVARMNNIKEQTDITSNDETITAINVNISGTEQPE